jgi:hypothetical protein
MVNDDLGAQYASRHKTEEADRRDRRKRLAELVAGGAVAIAQYEKDLDTQWNNAQPRVTRHALREEYQLLNRAKMRLAELENTP